MFNKSDAIHFIKNIQSGNFDRYEIDLPLGSVAVDLWNDDLFSYGMEYGAMLAMMKAFDVTLQDLGYAPDYVPPEPKKEVPEIYHNDRCTHGYSY